MKKNETKKEIKSLKLWKRWLVKFFLSAGSCGNDCSECSFCPWLDKEKYSFEIKRK
ncbi:MAG: hypothetical protein ACFFDS_07250 [Candidatus Thorarchaeota archaeon]